MAEVKASANKNAMQKIKKFHVETEDTLIYETEFMSKTFFWLDAAVKVGDKTVHCYSSRGAKSRSQIEMFANACKSLAPKQ